jgi:glutaredoxin
LTSNNVSFKDMDVAKDEAARKEMSVKTQGKLVVPVVDIDGEVSVGYDEAWIKSKLGLK